QSGKRSDTKNRQEPWTILQRLLQSAHGVYGLRTYYCCGIATPFGAPGVVLPAFALVAGEKLVIVLPERGLIPFPLSKTETLTIRIVAPAPLPLTPLFPLLATTVSEMLISAGAELDTARMPLFVFESALLLETVT